ncbi:lytic transglycosylase domain-containing protein [Streptomyces sp. APSN-46.1]|uniref:lytic transglycosylase domain-containing protein n=1 Tax=Streptomyces sp. APSN-46.1 TaxID=2929049 RepID=UPI001FB40290|nr:lytic transglycosylase domain-containing protein [Streptomyces sp. APSN-46.1]MCJ1679280.1 lytic transglycosylase domain-containing protein [Streptomyces sp. APSN-46.1]
MKPLQRHLVNTSRKVLCTAALAASLTTAAVVTSPTTADAGESEPSPDSPQATDRGDARLDLPAPVADPQVPPTTGTPEGSSGIPGTALDAYKRAELSVAAALPGCKLPWQLLAGIGRVESVHASGYGLKMDGYTEKPIRGPQLNGNGFAEIRDTDKGEWDADATYDRAVGPMQFIPSTWSKWGADGNGDTKRDPNNIYDAALGAGLYLCAGDRDLSDPAALDRAILSYNNSREYVNTVLGYMRQYKDGVAEVPNPPAGNYPTPPTTGGLPTPQPPRRTTPPPKPTPTPTPPAKPTPTTPTTPTKPPTTPSTPTTPTTPTTPSKPTPAPATLAKVELVGESGITAEAGAAFSAVPRVKAVLSDGKPAEKQVVVFAVEDDTTDGTGFGTSDSLVVRTDEQGIAVAPGLKAGAKAGTFTLRATAYDATNQFTVAFKGTVTAQPVVLARTDGGTLPLEAVAGTSIKGVELAATAGGKPVAGLKTTAGLVEKDEAGKWQPVKPEAAGKVPYFKGAAEGEKLTSVALAPSAADGKITVPELFTSDVAPGTYHLRVITPEGVALILELKITAKAEATPQP